MGAGSLTGDCAKLGITLSNSTSSNTTDNSSTSSSGTNSGKGGCPNKLYFQTILVLAWFQLKLFNVLPL